MKKEINLLSKGLFASKALDSKVKTRIVTKKEKIFGHLIGPLGLIFVVNTIAALVEKFFTQQTGAMYGVENVEMIQKMGGYYGIIMAAAKVLAVGMGLLNSWLISHTKSKHGRLRPWYLVFGFVSIIIAALMFLFPGNTFGESYWYYFFILLICYHTVGSTYFFLFKDTIVSLVTRDPKEKTQLSFIRKMSWTLISGIIIGMLVSSVILPFWLEKDINGYAILMIILSIISVPLLLMEYFYTKERVIEDIVIESGQGNQNKVPLKAQMKALLSNKFFMFLTVLVLVGGIVDNFKGGNVQFFYIKFMLNGAENGMMFMLYQIITGVPLGLGAIIAYPLARKFGIKNIAIVGYGCVLGGSVLGWLFPSQMVPAMIAGFLRQLGMIPNAYVFATLICFAYDSIEHKSGFRLEGLFGAAIFLAIQSLIYAPFAGGYESGILKLGFVDAEGVVPNANITSFMTMSFYLLDIILAVAHLVLLPFIDIEKKLPEINAELLRRKKEAVLASGGTWLEPKEQDRVDREKAEAEHEKNRVIDLMERCEKKKLVFDIENTKYLTTQKEKERRWEEKQSIKGQKNAEKELRKKRK